MPKLTDFVDDLSPAERKLRPVFSGVLKYFPDALMLVSHVSQNGNNQHHPGADLHWDKTKSSDEADALLRHLIEYAQGKRFDTDGVPILGKVAWRGLALLQREIEKDRQKGEK